jgi:hypothetical protein
MSKNQQTEQPMDIKVVYVEKIQQFFITPLKRSWNNS